MNKKHRSCCIIIPIYKANPTNEELASFRQAYKVLERNDIYIITHQNLNIFVYQNECPQALKIKYFKSNYFNSIEGYNKLMCSKEFYKSFLSYHYMLIYQLDAWVFKDELNHWCRSGYDYIGAPWFANDNLESFIGVGNGGLSLRKITSHLKVLNNFYILNRPYKLIKAFLRHRIGYTAIKNLICDITIRNFSHHLLAKNIVTNEDVFWNQISNKKLAWYRVPDTSTASQFSTEINSEQLFEANNSNLPFGCHAWERYHKDFWQQFIHIDKDNGRDYVDFYHHPNE